MATPLENPFHVMRHMDVGTHIYYPWIDEGHARELADIMNRIEATRVERLGGNRENGDGNFFTVEPAEPRKVK